MTASHNTPPHTLDCDIEVGPKDWQAQQFYHLMTALVIPRPIGWISTISASGISNVAPYSYFNMMGNDPPYVAFASTGVKDTLNNLREIPHFVANIVTMDLLEEMNFTSGDFPRDESEFGWAGLTAVPSVTGKAFRVLEAKAHIECEVKQIITDNNTNIVLGKILHTHVQKSVWKEGRIDPQLLNPVCRLSGSGYAQLGEIFNVARPVWKEVKQTQGKQAMPKAVKR
jgi:flavin reductase (DIM6/NTAB) family NADH-FMN oxidoreductase RutF